MLTAFTTAAGSGHTKILYQDLVVVSPPLPQNKNAIAFPFWLKDISFRMKQLEPSFGAGVTPGFSVTAVRLLCQSARCSACCVCRKGLGLLAF